MALQRLIGTRVAFLHARTPTHSSPDVKTGRGTAMHTAAFVHVLVLLASGLALCYWESNNLTRLAIVRKSHTVSSHGVGSMGSGAVCGRRVEFLHARTPTHSPPEVKTGRSNPRSLYTLLHLCIPLFCLLRDWLFAIGIVLT